MEIQITYCSIDRLYYVRLYNNGKEVAELGSMKNRPTKEKTLFLYQQWNSKRHSVMATVR